MRSGGEREIVLLIEGCARPAPPPVPHEGTAMSVIHQRKLLTEVSGPRSVDLREDLA